MRVNDTTVTATAYVAANAPTGANKRLIVTNNASRGYGSSTFKGLTITN